MSRSVKSQAFFGSDSPYGRHPSESGEAYLSAARVEKLLTYWNLSERRRFELERYYLRKMAQEMTDSIMEHGVLEDTNLPECNSATKKNFLYEQEFIRIMYQDVIGELEKPTTGDLQKAGTKAKRLAKKLREAAEIYNDILIDPAGTLLLGQVNEEYVEKIGDVLNKEHRLYRTLGGLKTLVESLEGWDSEEVKRKHKTIRGKNHHYLAVFVSLADAYDYCFQEAPIVTSNYHKSGFRRGSRCLLHQRGNSS